MLLLTSLLGDKQAQRDWVGSWYNGIPSHPFVTKQQSCLYSINFIGFGYTF